jgi:hypothetical protein
LVPSSGRSSRVVSVIMAAYFRWLDRQFFSTASSYRQSFFFASAR